MSRQKDNYENSRWLKFKRWVDGEVDPLAHGMETVKPEPESDTGAVSCKAEPIGEKPAKQRPERQAETAKEKREGRVKEAVVEEARTEEKETAAFGRENYWEKENKERDKERKAISVSKQMDKWEMEERDLRIYRKVYQVLSVILCISISIVLLWTITYLPEIGSAGNPDNNEVSARYIEQGLKETGAVNIVTGMILDYRAFDTFGESCVLFIASCCVLVLLRIDRGKDGGTEEEKKRLEEANDRLFEPKNDIILQKCSCVLVPVIFIFGIYIVLNGHLSPGGGFSGGAVLGSGLILYLNAFGFGKMGRLMTEKLYRRVTLSALTFYCLAKSYSFFTGANHLESGIPLGTPGAIFSSGLILPLNICVGLVVACTMYSFYALFRKGGM